MSKKSGVLFFFFILTLSFAQRPIAGRLWTYVNFTGLLSNEFAFVIMPGFRYEFSRKDENNGVAKKTYFYELLTGPVYIIKIKDWILKLPVWYYYMGFPVAPQDDYFYSHNLEFLPIVEFRSSDFTFISRTIFHNTIYASIYEQGGDRKGYGLVIREMFKICYQLSDRVDILIADEPFFGVIEDSEASIHPLGYWQKGFRMNRLYAGCNIRMTKHLSLSPQYVFETNYDTNGQLDAVNHYLFLTISCAVRFFE
jgi:hypothetical protein